MTIGDKIFSYIDSKEALTEQMLANYRNSLIFIGDERQIYNPITGAYVGIGMSYFNEVKNEILNSTEMTKYLDQHIHQNVVNSIWVEYNEEQINSVFTNFQIPPKSIGGQEIGMGDATKLMTNQDIVVKGLHDYDKNTSRAKTTDDIGWQIKDENDLNNINNVLWRHIDLGTYGSSGITVNVHHSTAELKNGIDSYGFAYSYYEGQDYLTIDDHLTWSYIAEQTSYIMHFSKQMAVQQANRVYHDILGGNDPVYIEKEFNEVFTFDEYGDLKQIVDGELGRVYIHVKDPNDPDNNKGKYIRARIYNDDNYYYVYTQNTNVSPAQWWIIDTNDNNFATNNPTGLTITITDALQTQTITLQKPTDEILKNWLFPDDGYDTIITNDGESWKVAWYHLDAEATAQGKINLADGIQTLKEVAEVLDRITDGSDDDVINLTYNIAQNHIDIEELKRWQEAISDNVVSSIEGTTENKFVMINSYSSNNWEDPITNVVRGDAKIDISLRLAQTYTESGSTYAAYLYSEHVSKVEPIYQYLGDDTNAKYYRCLTNGTTTMSQNEFTVLLRQLRDVYGNNANITLLEKVPGSNEYQTFAGGTVTINQLETLYGQGLNNFQNGLYILFNYKELDNTEIQTGSVLDGITTVSWVTTYFKWAREDIFDEVERLDEEIKDWIQTYITGMESTDTEQPGQYVSKVDQVNGKVVVTRRHLPLDTIIYSPEIYGNDFFIEITPDRAEKLLNPENLDSVPVYFLDDSNVYRRYPSYYGDEGYVYYIRAKLTNFIRIIDNENEIDTDTELKTVTDALIANEGNFTYFINKSNKKVIPDGTEIDVTEYTPVDIQELLTNTNNDFLSRNTLSLLYYYNDSATLFKSSKYFDVSYHGRTDGGTDIAVSTYVTYLGASSSTNTGLADSYDVRHTIESMFTWINLRTNKRIDDDHPLILQTVEPENP